MSQSDFFSWYSSMEFDDGAVKTIRWNQLQNIVKAPSRQLKESLIRLAFRTKISTAEANVVRTQFSEGAPPPGDEELSMLAASAIAALLAKRDADSATVAVFTVAATCAGQRPLRQPMNLLSLAEEALANLSETARRRPSLEYQRLAKPLVDPKAALDAVQAIDLTSIHAGLNALASSFNNAISAVVSRQRQFEVAVQEYVLVQDEELDILWWLQGGRSEACNLPFEDIPATQRPLVFAKDLAELTTVMPGPSALVALLNRAGIDCHLKTSVVEAVQSVPNELLDSLLPETYRGLVSPAITPILEAVRRRQELNGKEGWAQAWDEVCGLNHQAHVPALKIAEAAYRELLVVHFG